MGRGTLLATVGIKKGHGTWLVKGKVDKGMCDMCVKEEATSRNMFPPKSSVKLTAFCKGCYRYLNLWRKYGILPIEFDDMMQLQDNACAMCFVELKGQPCVDMNKVTGKLHALLCHECNTMVKRLRSGEVSHLMVFEYIVEVNDSEWVAPNGAGESDES